MIKTGKNNTKPDFNTYTQMLEIKTNPKTYIEAKAIKEQIDSFKQQLYGLKEAKLEQERKAVKLREEFNAEWNKYLELRNQEEDKRNEIINFILGE